MSGLYSVSLALYIPKCHVPQTAQPTNTYLKPLFLGTGVGTPYKKTQAKQITLFEVYSHSNLHKIVVRSISAKKWRFFFIININTLQFYLFSW